MVRAGCYPHAGLSDDSCAIACRDPYGQTIYVTEGLGLCQHRGDPVEVIRFGDRVFFEPGEDHRHGASPNRFMIHIAMQEVDLEGSTVTWGEHVSDEEYGAAPPIDG